MTQNSLMTQITLLFGDCNKLLNMSYQMTYARENTGCECSTNIHSLQFSMEYIYADNEIKSSVAMAVAV